MQDVKRKEEAAARGAFCYSWLFIFSHSCQSFINEAFVPVYIYTRNLFVPWVLYDDFLRAPFSCFFLFFRVGFFFFACVWGVGWLQFYRYLSPNVILEQWKKFHCDMHQQLTNFSHFLAAGIVLEEKNWPPFFPIIHHDITNEIPIHLQKLQYVAFTTYLGMSSFGWFYGSWMCFFSFINVKDISASDSLHTC